MERIEGKLAALEQTIEALRAELDSVRQQRRGSMQQTAQCPACDGAEILHVRRVKEAAYGSSVDLSVGGRFSAWKGHIPGDPFEVFVCRACGLVEWHVASFDTLTVDGKNVVALARDKPASTDPYR